MKHFLFKEILGAYFLPVEIITTCIVSRLAGQSSGSEHRVTIDRFRWHGGIKKRDVMANIMRQEHNIQCLHRHTTASMISKEQLCCLCSSLATVKDIYSSQICSC